eukprot:832774-Rhodomonas_salina.2
MSGGAGRKFRGSRVVLNVYDLSPVNSYVYDFGVGAFHSGVEIGGTEYTFGGHESSSSGVFTHAPKQAPNAQFRISIDMGETDKSNTDISAEVFAKPFERLRMWSKQKLQTLEITSGATHTTSSCRTATTSPMCDPPPIPNPNTLSVARHICFRAKQFLIMRGARAGAVHENDR